MPAARLSKEIQVIEAPFDVTMQLPGSKSIALRQLAISALARNPTTLYGLDESDDLATMIACVRGFGVIVDWSHQECWIDPRRFNMVEPIELDVNMSGLTLRLLISVAALRSGLTRFVGHSSLQKRPNKELLDALKKLGCRVESTNGFLPILVQGPARGGRVVLTGSVSSQYLSSLLIAGCRFEEGVEIELSGEQVSGSYIEVTLKELDKRGVQVEHINNGYRVRLSDYLGESVSIEGDASAATYFSALATLHASRIAFSNLGVHSCQGDRKFLDLCNDLGAKVSWGTESASVEGPSELNPVNYVDMVDMPDAALTMMAMAPYLSEKTTVTGLASLPFKECNRIACPARELRRAGVTVEESSEHVVIYPSPLTPASFETYEDHRMAMAFSVLGTKTPGCNVIDPDCVRKTYPNYWHDLERLYQQN